MKSFSIRPTLRISGFKTIHPLFSRNRLSMSTVFGSDISLIESSGDVGWHCRLSWVALFESNFRHYNRFHCL